MSLRQAPHLIAAWIITSLLLVASLTLHLVPALLAGLLVYELVARLAPLLQKRLSSQGAILVAIMALATTVVTLVTFAFLAIVSFLHSDAGSLPNLFAKLADIIEGARSSLPVWITDALPDTAEELQTSVVALLKEHARDVQWAGKEAAITLAHILVGMIIGAMVSISASYGHSHAGPLAQALTGRARRLGTAFSRIVFAQVQISAVNTVLTALFLAIVMPMLGIHLPLVKTLILVTFLAGLMPVVGNLISNTVITLAGLSVSLQAGLLALAFLIGVHKLEYFLNARIVGTHISARAWELLTAMLLMEAAFGLAGLVAAPIFYAYLKDELTAAQLV